MTLKNFFSQKAGILQVTFQSTETQDKFLTIQNYRVTNTRRELLNAMKANRHNINESDDFDTLELIKVAPRKRKKKKNCSEKHKKS